MTGVELQKYLMDSGLFTDENVYMVEISDSGEIFNKVPSYYKMFIPMLGKLEISIYYNKHSDGTKYIDFTLGGGGVNLFASHKLKDLDITTLCSELNKILSNNKRFIEWSTKELRDYKINSLI